MTGQRDFAMTIEAEFRVPIATTQLAHFHMPEPVDVVFRTRDEYWLDMCLTPRPANARAAFRNGTHPGAFDRIGDVFLAPPGEAMHARSDGGHQVSIVCHLRPEQIDQWFDGTFAWTARRLDAMLDIPNAAIRGLLLRLAGEARQPGFASEILVELIVAQIAIELARHCSSVTEEPATGGLAPWRLRIIDKRLAEPGDAPTLGELARLCNLSVRQLTRGFRESCGMSIGEHVIRSRIDCAKRLLATDESIKAVAYSMGFATPSSFCTAFRRETGEAPSQFRARLHARIN
jgi:AraC family transcriptional regulator